MLKRASDETSESHDGLKRHKQAENCEAPQDGKDTAPTSAVDTPPEAAAGGLRPDEATDTGHEGAQSVTFVARGAEGQEGARNEAATSDTASAVAALSMLHATPFDPEEVDESHHVQLHGILIVHPEVVASDTLLMHEQFMKNLASKTSHHNDSPLQTPVLVRSNGTRVSLDSAALQKRLGALSESYATSQQYADVNSPAGGQASSGLSSIPLLSPLTPRNPGCEPEEATDYSFAGGEISNADAQAIAALHLLGAKSGALRGCNGSRSQDLVSPSSLGVNSRHGAARGRAVTR